MVFVQDCLSEQRLALVRCHLDELDCTINGRIASYENPWMLLAEAQPPYYFDLEKDTQFILEMSTQLTLEKGTRLILEMSTSR